MALQLDMTDEKGVKTRYHKITVAQCDWTPGTTATITVVVRSYVNKALRDKEDKTGVDTSYTSRWITLPAMDTITLDALYTALKTMPDWHGATDC